jgi:hypothetical protein
MKNSNEIKHVNSATFKVCVQVSLLKADLHSFITYVKE